MGIILKKIKFVHRKILRPFNKEQYFIFHHIPKCGGTSIRFALKEWFKIVEDYRKPEWTLNELFLHKKDLTKLTKNKCLVGHFDVPHYYLKERYPQIIAQNKYFLFSFIRDPLELKISLYFYELKTKGKLSYNLEDRLLGNRNYMANRFPCDEFNYKKVLDRYNFVGITDKSQESIDKLADLIGKHKVKLPLKNKSSKTVDSNQLSPALVNRFKDINRLDYKIYDYSLHKLFK